MANEDRQAQQGATRAGTPSFKKAIRVQGGVIENFRCQTDVPVIIEGAVKGAQIKASWVEVLPGASMSGTVVADHMVVRGRVSSLTATVHDFFAMDSAIMEACHIIFDTVRGCSIHPQSQFLGSVQFSLKQPPEGKKAPSAPAPAAKVEPPKAPVAPPQPVQPQVAPTPQATPVAPVEESEAAPEEEVPVQPQPQVSLGDASRAAAQYAQQAAVSAQNQELAESLSEGGANIEETDDGYASLGATPKTTS